MTWVGRPRRRVDRPFRPLASPRFPAIFPRMKFLLAMLTFAVLAAVLALGILKAVTPNGSPWLLIAGVLGYIVLFWKIGCAEEH
jgi:hypothetical protein